MTKDKLLLALDVDSTKIGICILDEQTGSIVHSSVLISQKKLFARTLDLRKQFGKLLKRINNEHRIITKCIIEDYGYYPVQRYANMKAELVGMIRWLLAVNKIWNFFYITTKTKGRGARKKTYTFECSCAPVQLKKFIHGTGVVPKSGKSSALMLEVYKLTGYEFKSDDQADAYMLALMLRVYTYCSENEIVTYEEYQKRPVLITRSIGTVMKLVLNKNKFDPIHKWLKGQGD